MSRFARTVSVILVLAATVCLAGTQVDRDVLYQVSTLNSLMQGVYDGEVTIGELKRRGDFGIGTVDGLDGELVVVDGRFYQVKSDGIAYPVAASMKTPFAAVTWFDADVSFQSGEIASLDDLKSFLDQEVKTKNILYAVRITGTFDYLKARSVPRQNKPYPTLAEALKNQSIFEFDRVKGVIVGIRCPDYMNGLNLPGYHFHFITEDRKRGGHVLELRLTDAQIEFDDTFGFSVKLPHGGDFFGVDLTGTTKI